MFFMMITACFAQNGKPYDFTQEQKPILPNSYKTPGYLFLPKPTVDEMCTPGWSKNAREVSASLKKQPGWRPSKRTQHKE